MTPAAAFWLRFRPADGWPWVYGGPYATPFEAGRDGAMFVAATHPQDEYGSTVQLRLLGVDRTGEWCDPSERDEDVFDCGWDRATT